MKTSSTVNQRFLLVFLAILSIMPMAWGQTITATLTGTLTDPSGGVVPGVTVTATNQGTQISFTAESNNAGVYNIPFLPAGN